MAYARIFTRRYGYLSGALIVAVAAGCVQEDWGGPKGPPPPRVAPIPAVVTIPGDGGGASNGPNAADTTSETSAAWSASPTALATSSAPSGDTTAPSGDGGGSGTPRVDATLMGGKIPGFDEAIAGMRSTLKACVEGKGGTNARVEITARVGPKGTVLKSDKIGGTSFGQGAVPCLVKRIEAAQFKKPTEGSPRITFRVRISND